MTREFDQKRTSATGRTVTSPTTAPGRSSLTAALSESPFGPGVVQRKAIDGAGPGKQTLTEQLPAAPTEAQPTAAEATPHKTIATGSTGSDVALAQSRLNAHNATPPLVEDGIFGPKTRGAALAFQNASNLSADGIIGPHTWASLDVPGSQSLGQGQGTPSPHKNVNYDTGGHMLAMLPTGTKLAAVKASVDALKAATPPEITAATVSGVTAKSDEEIFVWNVIAQLGSKDRWNSEVDLETAIGFQPAKSKAPVGLVTLRIDKAGKASAELIKATVATGTTFASFTDAVNKLKAEFGFSEVTNGSATWTTEELGKVHAALSTMGGGERSALAGVKLIREHTLALPDGSPAAGLFSHEVKPDATTGAATRAESLSLADGAFANDNISFVGGSQSAAPASFETILHEAGHAVETKVLRDAQFARLSAEVQNNQDIAVFNQANQDANAAVTDFNTESAAAFNLAKAYKADDRKAVSAYLSAVNAATTAIAALHKLSTANGSDAIGAKAVAAVAKRGSERAKLATANAAHPAFKDFTAAEAAQDKWLAAVQLRTKTLATVDASKAMMTTARATEKAAEGTGGDSKRLANFVGFVNKNKIEPFTDYARNNWPAHPAEFYAEAFSLFHTDPEFMQTNYKPLFDWFTNGEHLK